VGLEALARGLGTYDHVRRRPHHLWQMATTTKAHIADVANMPASQSVLVFHIAQYHQYELEHGARACQALMHSVAQRMRESVPPGGFVTPERNGTLIALLPVDREEAEGAAQRIIDAVGALRIRLAGRGDEITVRLACGIIAFPQAGNALALSVPAPA
jgi:GGDEF domain-containing protein